MIALRHPDRCLSGTWATPERDAPSVSSCIPDARCGGICRRRGAVAVAAAGRHSPEQRHAARAAVQARRRRPVPGGDRAARLRRPRRFRRAGAAALPRLGRAVAEGRQGGVAAGQLRLARTRAAMPRQGAPHPRPPRTGGRHHGLAAMAAAAALDGARPHQPDGMGQRRQRVAVGGASAIAVAQGRAGFPLGDRVLSGLPDLVRPRLERAGSDAAADRRQGRRQFAAGLPPDGRRRARPQRAGADRGLSRRLCTISIARIFRCRRSMAGPIPHCRNAAISAPIRKRARIRRSASRNGWRGEELLPSPRGEGEGKCPSRTNCPDRPA